MARAQSVVDVILGEARGGDVEDMRAVASAIANRAQQLGVPLESVVSVPSQFNAYGKPIPAGNNAYRRQAEQVLNEVLSNGPSHRGTFFATPAASGNLPRGLREVTSTAGHRYYEDPQGRSIMTSQGYRTPSMTAYAPTQQATSPFNALLGAGVPTKDMSIPTPTQRPEAPFQSAAARSVELAPLADIASVEINRPDTPFSRATPASTSMNPTEYQKSIDWGRMVDAPNSLSALASYDPSRFGSAVSAKSGRPGVSIGPEISADRFGYGYDVGTGMRSMPSIYGYTPEELLAMDVEEANPGRAAAQAAKSASYQAAQAAQAPKTYVDPTVTTAYAQQPAAGNTGSRAIDRQTTGAVGQKIGPDQATLDAAAKSAQLNDRLSQMQSKQMTGTVLGGLLGTAIAGPLGGILGVGLGNKWAGRTGVDYFPSAPSLGGRLAQLFGYDPGNGGMSGLTTNRLADVAAQYGINLSDADRAIYGDKSGRDMAMESGQLQNAVNSGKSGLW